MLYTFLLILGGAWPLYHLMTTMGWDDNDVLGSRDMFSVSLWANDGTDHHWQSDSHGGERDDFAQVGCTAVDDHFSRNDSFGSNGWSDFDHHSYGDWS